jgi:hypothetical protein
MTRVGGLFVAVCIEALVAPKEKATHEAGPVVSDEPQVVVSVCYRGLPASGRAADAS